MLLQLLPGRRRLLLPLLRLCQQRLQRRLSGSQVLLPAAEGPWWRQVTLTHCHFTPINTCSACCSSALREYCYCSNTTRSVYAQWRVRRGGLMRE